MPRSTDLVISVSMIMTTMTQLITLPLVHVREVIITHNIILCWYKLIIQTKDVSGNQKTTWTVKARMLTSLYQSMNYMIMNITDPQWPPIHCTEAAVHSGVQGL